MFFLFTGDQLCLHQLDHEMVRKKFILKFLIIVHAYLNEQLFKSNLSLSLSLSLSEIDCTQFRIIDKWIVITTRTAFAL